MDHETFIRIRNALLDKILNGTITPEDISRFNQMMTVHWEDNSKHIRYYEQIESFIVIPQQPRCDRMVIINALSYDTKRVIKTKIYHFVNRLSVTWEIEHTEEYDVGDIPLDRIA